MTELTNNIKNNNNIDNDGKLHSLVDDRTKYDEIFAAVFETLRTLENNPNKFIDKTIKKEVEEKMKIKLRNKRFECTNCSQIYNKHTQLHSHIAVEHGKTLVLCSHCKATSHSLWRTNVCHICMKYFYNLVEHEPSHYKDKEGSNALYECPHCYRSFARFPELKSHLVRHKKSCVKQYFKCQKCSSTFRSHHLRDQHIISHYKTIFDKIWEKFWSTQTCNKNQHCPLCSFMVTNKKSFRLHIIHRHAHGFSSEKLEELLSSLMTKFQAESDILKEFIEEQDEDFINNNSSAMNISDQRIEIVMDGPNEVSANESTAVQYEEQNCSPASIREKFISACLDINTNDLPKCTKCDCIFRHMVDFELHVIRDHSSDLIYNRFWNHREIIIKKKIHIYPADSQ